jgi:hypothetical protein
LITWVVLMFTTVAPCFSTSSVKSGKSLALAARGKESMALANSPRATKSFLI